ncbi:hypothetical protein SPRG_19275 [Saprolegnia parasitica CBS 223.65]|uniref:NECAP PHear domain-containing protein n=1 Tax=Saprolegnia parasitica (strain CBS 223.65) TaxID=695850 RepID=A0A067CT30_SAPPC|nr:hypothetical protein SPRG_19275 [Saprolegnia parasitica CBS 223.65]KDO33663.1 hypothetical protein SPRG_19275 [Saprolegnia parasitica CBS 223.65]|eukprot:XP_012195692.1 hypothetical protein SPRG_19275 [Saprolegnia parasitica CBS 223.65]
MADESIERVLTVINQCFAFAIPPQSSAAGHRADSWPKDPVWTGRLVISVVNDVTQVQLRDPKTGGLFAACPILKDGTPSQPDFVLRIVDAKSGRHAFIGIAFEDRNDAFDFNVAIDDHQNEIKREENAIAEASAKPAIAVDYALKQGQTIKIKLNKKTKDVDPSPAPVQPLAQASSSTKNSDLLGFGAFDAPASSTQQAAPSTWETF